MKKMVGWVLTGWVTLGIAFAEMVPLPRSYTRLEWIQSTGNQYIDAEYVFDAYDTFVVDCVVNFPQARTYPNLFGTRKGSNNADHAISVFLASNSTTTPRLSFYRCGANAVSTDFPTHRRLTITVTETAFSWRSPDGSVVGGVEVEPKKHEGGFGSLMIFGLNNASTATTFTPDGNSPSCVTLYSFTITAQDGTVRRSFIPCRRGEDGEAGLWDEVEGKFHGNRGTRRILGSDAAEVETLVDYMSATGTQAINTKYVHAFDDTFVADFTAKLPQNKTYAMIFGARKSGNNSNNATGFWLTQNSKTVFKAGYARSGGTNFNGGSGNLPANQRMTLTCGPDKADWRSADGTVVGFITVTPTKEEGGLNPIAIFGMNNTGTADSWGLDGNSWATADLYSFRTIKSDGTVAHDYVPYRKADGEVCLRDIAEGATVTSFSNAGSGDFGFGCAYTTNATALCVHEGLLTDDLVRLGLNLEKVGPFRVSATAVTVRLPALALRQGMFSLQDGAAGNYAIDDTLTLAGGAYLALDISESGCDVLVPALVEFENATVENPFVLKVAIDARADLTRKYTVVASGMPGAGTPNNIRVEGAPMAVEIRNGALIVQYDDPAMPVEATWQGNANAAVDEPANWICKNSRNEILPGVLPMAQTHVVLPDGCVFNCPRGSAFVCRSIDFPATLGGDCDWRGLSQPIDSTIHLNGHKLYLSQLEGAGLLMDTVNQDYVLVDYVSADGRQVVDTGYLYRAYDTMVADFTPFFPQVKTYPVLFGTRNNANNNVNATSFFLATGNNALAMAYYVRAGKNSGNVAGLPVNQRMTLTCDETSAVWKTADGLSTGKATAGGTTHQNGVYPLVIFGMNNGKEGTLAIDGNSWATVDLYSFRIYSNNQKLMRDYVPVKRLSDGAYGLYEACRREFFTAASVSSASLSGAQVGAVTARAPGEVHLDVPEGTTVTASSLALAGTLKLVKEGAGTLCVAKNDQTYMGGTDILEGTVRRAVTGAGSFLGRSGAVTIYPDGVLDFDGWGNQSLDHYVLAGGLLKSVTARSQQGFDWLQQVTLTADSTIQFDGAGFVGHGWDAATLEMNGHQLDLVTAGTKGIFMGNLTVTGGGRIVVRGGGTLIVGDNANSTSTTHNVLAETTTLEVRDAALKVVCEDVLFGGYMSAQPTGQACTGTGHLRIADKLTLKSEVFYPCTLLDGACIDLSEIAFVVPGEALTYETDATVQVDIGTRVVRANEKLIAWDAIPSATFRPTRESRCALIPLGDGLYVFRGFTIFVR